MTREFLFVSCDIIAHSAEASMDRQRENVLAINKLVADTLQAPGGEGAIWACGGDGGHVAFPIDGDLKLPLTLLFGLRAWSVGANVNLRITANRGEASVYDGADGRVQLVGHGINLAGRILSFSNQSRIVAAQEFVDTLGEAAADGVRFHDPRTVHPLNFPPQVVFLVSAGDPYHCESAWDPDSVVSDRALLQTSLEHRQPLDVVYRAKRLLQVNSNDPDARNSLLQLAIEKVRPSTPSPLLDLILDEHFGAELVNASSLIERHAGESVCEYGDTGPSMFLILKGNIGVFLPVSTHPVPTVDTVSAAVMGPGELTGELAFALRRPRTATLRCLDHTAVLAFSFDELMRALLEEGVRPRLEDTLTQLILSRVIQSVWTTAPVFNAKSDSDWTRRLMAPWLTLVRYGEMKTIGWNSGVRSLCGGDQQFEGVSILVSGSVEVEGGLVLNGTDYPVLCAKFPGEVEYQVRDCRIVDEIRILSIRKEGIARLGPDAYREIVKRVSEANPVPAAESPKTARGGKKHVFLSYCHDNAAQVKQLHDDLEAAGETVWWDVLILGGHDWRSEIRKALKDAYAVVVCLSEELTARVQSGVYPELLDVVKIYRNQAPGAPFIIPVRLSDCEIPDIEIDDTRTLDRIQTIDLFPAADRAAGLQKLLKALAASPHHP